MGFIALTLAPLLFSLYISFSNWPPVAQAEFTSRKTQVTILTDDTGSPRALWIPLKFVAMRVPANLTVALALAMLLLQDTLAYGFLRAAFYVPFIIWGVALVTIWSRLLLHDPTLGLTPGLRLTPDQALSNRSA